MSKAAKPRLGRGLSSLIGEPVRVEAPESPKIRPKTQADTAKPENTATGLQYIAIDAIVPSRFQPRRSFEADSLAQLAASIASSGVMQPVAVRAVGGVGARGGDAPAGAAWELVAGERRWRAARQAGLSAIPALVVTLSDRESAEWGLAENIQREDLNPIETALALRTLQREFGLTQTEIGERVGLDRSSVANTLRVLELEEDLQALVASGAVSAGHAKALLGAPAGPARVKLGRMAAEAGWSVRKLESFVRDASGVIAAPEGARVNGVAHARDSVREDLEKRIGEKLGTRVHLKLHADRKRGRLIIEFYDLDHFDGLLERFGCRD